MKKVPIPTKKDSIERFISEAEAAPVSSNFPWAGVDDRVMHTFNLRLAESEYLKLKFIAENTRYSVHSFIMENLRPAIDREIERLTR